MAGLCRYVLRSAAYRMLRVSSRASWEADRSPAAAGMLGPSCVRLPKPWHRPIAVFPGEAVFLRGLCTEAGVPFNEEEYPPLPEYSSNQPKEKELFIVCAKGLPWSCTAENLLEFFSDCNICDGVNGIHLMRNKNGQPSGKAFIEMERKEDLQKALRKHRHYLGPRYVEVKEATDSDTEGLQTTPTQLPAQDGVVKLQGLPYSCTVEEVVQFFSGLDIVENGVTFVLDKRGRRSGVAYVEFASQEMADLALQRDRETIGSRYIEVFPSRKCAVQSGYDRWGVPSPTFSSDGRPLRDDWNGKHAEHSRASIKEATDSDTEGLQTTPTQLPAQDGVVKLQGLPYSCTVEEVVQFFSGLDIVENGVTFVLDKRGRKSGVAFVEFASQEMADLALQRDRETIGSRYIEVFPSGKGAVPSQPDIRIESSRSTAEMNGEALARSQRHPQSSGSFPQGSVILQYCVHMRGLPYQATAQDIVNFFSPLRLARICMEYSGDGWANGEADVYFMCHEDAVSAMSRDKARMNERYIELFLSSTSVQSRRDVEEISPTIDATT